MTDRLLTPDEVREEVRLSESTIYRLRRQKLFPAPIIIGLRKHAWRESEIKAWKASRVAA